MTNHNKINMIDNMSQLRWACRRGMLELDILLGRFLDDIYPALELKDKEIFVKLLACSDPELFSWLMGKDTPDDAALKSMVDRIRQHARSGV